MRFSFAWIGLSWLTMWCMEKVVILMWLKILSRSFGWSIGRWIEGGGLARVSSKEKWA